MAPEQCAQRGRSGPFDGRPRPLSAPEQSFRLNRRALRLALSATVTDPHSVPSGRVCAIGEPVQCQSTGGEEREEDRNPAPSGIGGSPETRKSGGGGGWSITDAVPAGSGTPRRQHQRCPRNTSVCPGERGRGPHDGELTVVSPCIWPTTAAARNSRSTDFGASTDHR